ncbi:MAG: hypothetical protein IPK73_18045 [Candidatus Obscuribacter sp.]|nr:hypothetical protein [Candidatus Obscuribacter sp.]MBK9278470.1 hypothetical protein [Candidatus Obscuribacter sp.]
MREKLRVFGQITTGDRASFEASYGEIVSNAEVSVIAQRLASFLWSNSARLGNFPAIDVRFLCNSGQKGLLKAAQCPISPSIDVEYCLPSSEVSTAEDPEASFIEVFCSILETIATSSPEEIQKVDLARRALLLHRKNLAILFRSYSVGKFLAAVEFKFLEPYANFCQVYLRLKKKSDTHKEASRLVCEILLMELPYLLGKVRITDGMIRITASNLKGAQFYVERYRARGFEYPICISLDDFIFD